MSYNPRFHRNIKSGRSHFNKHGTGVNTLVNNARDNIIDFLEYIRQQLNAEKKDNDKFLKTLYNSDNVNTFNVFMDMLYTENLQSFQNYISERRRNQNQKEASKKSKGKSNFTASDIADIAYIVKSVLKEEKEKEKEEEEEETASN